MRIAVSITHTLNFEIPEGISIEEVRQEALGEINDRYTEEGEFGTGPSDQVLNLVQEAVKVGELQTSVVEVRIMGDK